MVFTAFLYASLIIFALGLMYKIFTWFSRKIGPVARNVPTSGRISAAVKGILGVVFSGKILTLIKVFILDVVLQTRILKENFLRWLVHMLIYAGLYAEDDPASALSHTVLAVRPVRPFARWWPSMRIRCKPWVCYPIRS